MTQAWLNRIGTAVPSHDIHAAFVEFGRDTIVDWHKRALFDRMANLSDIQHRYAIIEPGPKPRDKVLDAAGFYRRGAFPSTASRMAPYEPHPLDLPMHAVRGLDADPAAITHLIVASCTGFTAPGLDLQIMRAAGLPDSTQRTIVGFMGCFAAVNALKQADQIVRADPQSRVLVVNLKLCSLHLQEDFQDVPKMLSFLLFADGASAALVTAKPTGIALGRFQAALIPRSYDLITWRIGDCGFEMHLSGQVPGRIRRWLPEHGPRLLPPEPPTLWAVHAGGRSILDSVQQGLRLPPGALRYSREILRNYGNMSSATLMFVLQRILVEPDGRGPAWRWPSGLVCRSKALPSFGYEVMERFGLKPTARSDSQMSSSTRSGIAAALGHTLMVMPQRPEHPDSSQSVSASMPRIRPGSHWAAKSLLPPPPGDFELVERAILVLGSPRSGTTWLAKLLDSHPDVLYRHEPDEVIPPVVGVNPRVQLCAWIGERSPRVAASSPSFPKSWMPPPLAILRNGMARGLKGLSRMTDSRFIGAMVAVPDLIPTKRRPRVRPVIKLVDWDAGVTLQAIPRCRGLFILRHPCGQIASAMRGAEQLRFEQRPDRSLGPVGEHSASALAATRGVDAAAFRTLPTAARFAWIWRSFNEPALARMASLPNARVVLYEELCAAPERVTRELFRFVGLDWHAQTERFIARSTQNDNETDYYAVFRRTGTVAQRWRQTMTPADQEAVRMVVQDSPITSHWPELCG